MDTNKYYEHKYKKYKMKYLGLKNGGRKKNKDECVKSDLKKYKIRKSPPYPANKCKNMEKKGNDGKIWISKPYKKDIYRWVLKETKKPKKNPIKMSAKYKFIHNKKDLKASFMYYIPEEHKDKSNPEKYKEYNITAYNGAIKYASYVQKAFEDLYNHGIIAFIYPTGSFFIDWAWEDTENKIKNMLGRDKYMKKHWNEGYEEDKDGYPNVPYMFYMCPSETMNEIYIKHALPTKEQKKVVYDIMKKHFGNNVVWNRSDRKAIQLKHKTRIPKPKGRKVYGERYDKATQEKLLQWKKEYPKYKFIKIGKEYRWTSPTIEKYLKKYKKLRKILIKIGKKADAYYLDDNIYPLTPWVHPLEAEKEVLEFLNMAIEIIEEHKRFASSKKLN